MARDILGQETEVATEGDQLDPLCPRRPAGQSAVWCFQCGADYTADVSHCLECGVMTLPFRPTPVTKVGEPEEEQLVYDLHEWSWEARSLMASFMFAEDLVHGWQGASLVVRDADEQKVDELVARVTEAEMPSLDPAEPKMQYEIDELSDEQTGLLTKQLVEAGIAFEFNAEGNLVFHEKDEDRVEQVFDDWQETAADVANGGYADGEAVGGVAGGDGVGQAVGDTAGDGMATGGAAGAVAGGVAAGAGEFGTVAGDVHVPELLGTLYDMSGKLIANIGDVRATDELLAAVERLHMLELPFGFERNDWRELRNAAAEVAAVLDEDAVSGEIGGMGDTDVAANNVTVNIYAEGELGDEVVEEIKSACHKLRRQLKKYV